MKRLGTLAALYFVQGMPFGFQATALPIYLRGHGASLPAVGLAGALALPWMLKALWAPLVDRTPRTRWGRRRPWILATQIGLACACLLAAGLPTSPLTPLLLAVLSMNFFAATMDVAVDGLAVDLLKPRELGLGNAAQVVGYKLGMLTGGGLLVALTGRVGWPALFAAMAGVTLLVLLSTLWLAEPPARAGATDPRSLRAILRELGAAVRGPRALWLLLFVATYKLGEAIADAMFKPFLIDAGFSSAEIGLWVGTWGMGFSIAGSLFGAWLVRRVGLLPAVVVAASARLLPLGAEWWLAVSGATPTAVIVTTSAEHFVGGALTTAIFALMMARTRRSIGATHYTLLATVEVIGKAPASWTSGFLAASLGYAGTFAVAVVFSALFLPLAWPLRARGHGASTVEGSTQTRREK